MLRRFIFFGGVSLTFALPLIYFFSKSEKQMPWLVALVSFVVLAGMVGNWYVYFGGGRASVKKVIGWLAFNFVAVFMIAVAYMVITHQISINP